MTTKSILFSIPIIYESRLRDYSSNCFLGFSRACRTMLGKALDTLKNDEFDEIWYQSLTRVA